MKFSVTSGELMKSLSKASSVIPVKTAMPILQYFHFSLEKNSLNVLATDIDVSVSSTLEVSGKEDGKAIVPSKILMEILTALPNDMVLNFNINTDTHKIVIKTDRAEYKLTGQDEKEFPTLSEMEEENKISVEPDLLKRLITRTIFAVSRDDLRPALTGVLFHLLKNEIRAVSTDGHRLAKIVVKNFNYNDEKSMIIPGKSLNVILKCFDENLQYISANPTHAIFVFEKSIIKTRLIDESYPNYESVIPTETGNTLTINRNELVSAVARTSIFTNNPNNLIKFSIDNGELTISADDPDFGMAATEKIKCEFDNGKFEIGFNARYVIDILNHIDSEEVNFLLTSPNRAAKVIPKDKPENEDVIMLIMPLRLNT